MSSRSSLVTLAVLLPLHGVCAQPEQKASKRPVAAEELVIIGQVVEGGVECPLFRTDDAQVYSLDSFTKEQLPVGTRMRLRGRLVIFSFCGPEPTFTVIERLG